jgi:hypothetical protein
MACSCCGKRLNSGMIKKRDSSTRKLYKSCPHCSDANGKEHVHHPYPANFGNTPARMTARNPDGDQSYCAACRRLKKGVVSQVHTNGKTCSSF